MVAGLATLAEITPAIEDCDNALRVFRPGNRVKEVGMRRLGLMVAVLALAGCISYSSSPSPTVIVPPGATVICPNGSPAVLSGNVYRC